MMIHAVSGAQGRILKVIGSGASSISPAPPICSTPKPPSASNSGNTGVFDESFPRLEKVSATPFCRASRKFSVLNAFLRIIPCWSLYTTRTVVTPFSLISPGRGSIGRCTSRPQRIRRVMPSNREWGCYDLDFDNKKGVLRRNNRRIWHIN